MASMEAYPWQMEAMLVDINRMIADGLKAVRGMEARHKGVRFRMVLRLEKGEEQDTIGMCVEPEPKATEARG